jgi:hypothetical protein
MNPKLIFLAAFVGLVALPPALSPVLVRPAQAACDPGDKLDKSTIEDVRALLAKAGYKDPHNWRKGCDNTWHGTAAKDGVTVNLAVLADGHVVRESGE